MTFTMKRGATLVRWFTAAARSAGTTGNKMTHGTRNEHSRKHDARHADGMAAACATCRARGACNFDAVNLAAMLDAHIPIVANQALPCTRSSVRQHCKARNTRIKSWCLLSPHLCMDNKTPLGTAIHFLQYLWTGLHDVRT